MDETTTYAHTIVTVRDDYDTINRMILKDVTKRTTYIISETLESFGFHVSVRLGVDAGELPVVTPEECLRMAGLLDHVKKILLQHGMGYRPNNI